MATLEPVHKNANGVVFYQRKRNGKVEFKTECPHKECDLLAIVTYVSDASGKVLEKQFRPKWSCGCAALCSKCSSDLLRALKRLGLAPVDTAAFKCFCFISSGLHYRHEERWNGKGEWDKYLTPHNAPKKQRTSEDGATPAMGPAGRRGSLEASVRMLDDINPGLRGALTSVVRKFTEEELEATATKEELEVTRLQLLVLDTRTEALAGRVTTLEKARVAGGAGSGNLREEDFSFLAVDSPGGVGHLAKAATPSDEESLKRTKNSKEPVERIVAGKHTGRHMVITLAWKKALEEGSGWMLMVTAMHHIAFAAEGDLDPRAPDVFCVEDIGGVQEVEVSAEQEEVKDDEVMMVPSDKEDGTGLFKSREEVDKEGLHGLVVGVRMGEVAGNREGKRTAVCYSRAGFYDAELVQLSIHNRATAKEAAEEDWRKSAAARIEVLEQEVAAATARCQEKSAMAEEQERKRQVLEEQQKNGPATAEMMKSTLEVVDKRHERQLLEEQKRLARLVEGLKTEKRIAERYRQELEEKEEMVRVMALEKDQLQEELMAEKKRRQQEERQRGAFERELEKRQEALKVTLGHERTRAERLEVELAAGRAKWTREGVKMAQQQHTRADRTEVQLRCELAEATRQKEEAEAALTLLGQQVQETNEAAEREKSEAEEERGRVVAAAVAAKEDDERMLKAKVAEVEAKLRLALEARDRAAQLYEKLEEDLQQEREEREKVAAELDEEQKRRTALEETLENSQQATADASAELAKEKEATVELQSQLSQQQQLVQDKEEELQKTIEAAEREKSKMQEERDRAVAAAVAAKEEDARMWQAREAEELRLRQKLEEDLEQEREERKGIDAKNEELARQLDDEQKQRTALEITLKESQTATADALAELAKEKEATVTLEQTAMELKEEAAKEREENGRLSKQMAATLEEEKQTTGTLTAEVKQLRGEVEKEREERLAAVEAREQLEVERDAAVQEKKETAAELEQERGTSAALETEVAQLRKTAAAVKATLGGWLEHERPRLEGEVLPRLLKLLKLLNNPGNDATVRKALLEGSDDTLEITLPEEGKGLAGWLSGNGTARQEAARLLADAVALSGTVRKLRIRGMDGHSTAALALGLRLNCSLVYLDLEGNIGEEGARRLAEALQGHGSLEVLDLGWCSIGEEGAGHLAQALLHNGSLRELNLWGNAIGDEGARRLAEALQGHGSLEELNLGGCSIGEEGAGHLAQALLQNGSLRELNLWGNAIGNSGVRRLAEALQGNGSLEVLYLENCSIGEEGAGHLAQALLQNGSLRTLDLGSNAIGNSGVRRLAEALQGHGSLEVLGLWECSIGEEGAGHLAQALLQNGSLRTLDLGENAIGEEGARRLAEALQGNGSLEVLNLGGNSFPSAFKSELKAIDGRISC